MFSTSIFCLTTSALIYDKNKTEFPGVVGLTYMREEHTVLLQEFMCDMKIVDLG